MIGWLLFGGLALATMMGLYYGLRNKAPSGWLLAMVPLFAAIGYAVQGHPDDPGAPAPTPPSSTASEAAFAGELDRIAPKDGATPADAARWGALAQSYMAKGDNRMAAALLGRAVRLYPRDPDLAAALGQALILHAQGVVTPAATYAFDTVRRLQPGHPAPDYYAGLRLVQEGRLDDAAAAWRGLLERSPKDAPWRGDIEQRLRMIESTQAEQRDAAAVEADSEEK